MLNRHLKAFGLPPILGYILAILLFIGSSIYLFYKTEYAAFIYIFLAVSTLSLLSEIKRNDFLKTCLTDKNYIHIRLIENSLVTLPFLLFLSYQKEGLFILVLLVIATFMARFQFNNQLNYTLPTPFYKYPFEFTVGFRTAATMIGFAYFLTLMGISVGNFNLGIFGLIVVFLTSFSFYAQPDSQYYVWIFATTPKGFLFDKIKIGLSYLLILVSPILIGLCYYFPEKIFIILIFQGLGMLYLIAVILAKYAAFPRAMNLPETLFLIGGVFFPPFLLFVLPYFYKQSLKKLKPVLE